MIRSAQNTAITWITPEIEPRKTLDTTSMSYFTPAYHQFFMDLARNNHRDWFQAQKKHYEAEVKKPFLRLVADLITELQQFEPEIQIQPKDAIFRINRDTRFSANKEPYKLQLAAVISRINRKDLNYPAFYMQAGLEGLMVGGGIYQPDKQGLQQIRQHIADNPEAYRAAVQDPEFVRLYGTIKGEQNKVLPKELKPAGEREPHIFNKQFYYATHYNEPEHLLRDDLLPFLVDHYHAGQPLNHFLKAALHQQTKATA